MARPVESLQSPARPGGLRAAQKAATRLRLMEAAMEVFAEKGYAATRVDDIARTAGASPATFYLHFRRKVDVLIACIQAQAAEVSELSEPLRAPTGRVSRELLRSWAERLFAYWENLRQTQQILRQAAVLEPELGAHHLHRLAEGIDYWESFLLGVGAPMGSRLRTEAMLIDATFVGLFEMAVVSEIHFDAGAMAEAVADDLYRRISSLRRAGSGSRQVP